MGRSGSELHEGDWLNAAVDPATASDVSLLLEALGEQPGSDPREPARTPGHAPEATSTHAREAAPGHRRETRSPFLQRRDAAGTAPDRQAFTADWLALREPFDARARSRPLARRFAGMLPAEPKVMDLGAGRGSLFRWLAPIIGRTQHWLWLDDDPDHLEDGLLLTAAWARRQGYTVHRREDNGTDLTLETRQGTWRINARSFDLRNPDTLFFPLEESDAVVCSALLDLFSQQWLSQVLRLTGRVPVYAVMNVLPAPWRSRRRHDDAPVLDGYLSAQVGEGGPNDPMGPHVPLLAKGLAAVNGRHYQSERSDWTIRPRDRAMLRQVLGFFAKGARTARPQHRRHIDAWQRTREADVAAGRLALRIAHRDILISPPDKGTPNAARRRRG